MKEQQFYCVICKTYLSTIPYRARPMSIGHRVILTGLCGRCGHEVYKQVAEAEMFGASKEG